MTNDIDRRLFKAWRRLHAAGDHRACTITEETRKVEVGRDYNKKYLAGPINPDGTRDLLDMTSVFGDPVYGEQVVPVHRYALPLSERLERYAGPRDE